MAEELPFEGETVERAESEPAFFVDLDGFEGPLDLLLELARRQKVDLHRISVGGLCVCRCGVWRSAGGDGGAA